MLLANGAPPLAIPCYIGINPKPSLPEFPMNRLDGKIAFLSGAARGIGAETARLMVEAGAKVALGDLLDERGRETVRGLEAAGGEALYVHHDVTRADDWAAAIDATVARFGGLDILVNNAGVLIAKSFEDSTAADRGAPLQRQPHRRHPGCQGRAAGAARARRDQPPGQRHRQPVVGRGPGRLGAGPALFPD